MGQFDIDVPSEGKLCVCVMAFSGDLGAHGPTGKVIASTPGFQAFVVRTWVLLLRSDTHDFAQTPTIRRLETQFSDFDEACSPLNRPLCSAMIDIGLMDNLTGIAGVVSYGTLPLAQEVLNICLVILCDMLLLASGYGKLRRDLTGVKAVTETNVSCIALSG
ncbi:hypothetical protein C8R47DRAFT_1324090 [Mycena vitilis]|nr:hypothetical protein C8R47DRAFT_1324090 [Mycena vitilis]